MIRQGRILVPTDFSEMSSEALRRAGVLARAFDAEVVLLHVLEPALVYDPEFVSLAPVQEITDAMREGAFKRLKVQAAGVDFPVRTELIEGMGQTARSICDFAKAQKADLIVIGRHGRQGFLEHLLLGSTAERVVRHAPCSVLVAMPHGLLGDHKEAEG